MPGSGNGQPDLVAGSRAQPPRRFGAEHGRAGPKAAPHQPDRRVLARVGGLEAEEFDRAADLRPGGGQRPGWQVGERELVGLRHPRQGGDAIAQAIERHRVRQVRGVGDDLLARGDRRAQVRIAAGWDRAPCPHRIGEANRLARRHRSDVEADQARPMGEGALARGVAKRQAVAPGAARDVGEGGGELVVDNNFIRRGQAEVSQRQLHRCAFAAVQGATAGEPLLEPDPLPQWGGEHALHIDGDRRDRALGHRGPGPVDEEQHPGEQRDPQHHADQRCEGAARVAQQVAPRVAKHPQKPPRRATRRSRPPRTARPSRRPAARPRGRAGDRARRRRWGRG